MSLPIESLRDVTGKTLSVVLTVILGNDVEIKTYPGCFAVRTGDEVKVFLYADHEGGRVAYARAVWNARIVQGIEHFGEHPEHEQWEASHQPPTRRREVPQITHPKPAAGPDYPGESTLTERLRGLRKGGPGAVVTTGGIPANNLDDSPVTVVVFPEDDGGTPPTSSTPESAETTTTPPESPEEQTAWMPPVSGDEYMEPENEFEEGWKPRSRPTPHREAKEVQAATLKRSRGTAKRAVRGAGMALLLGFALLGFSPNR